MISYPLRQKLPHFVSLTRINRPIGIYLLMWPMLWAFWMAAAGIPNIDTLVIFLLGTVLTRSAGCAINDYADRHIDAHVSRTANRPLATGALSAKEALVAAAALMLLAFFLVLLTNQLTIVMSFGALILASIYPFSKRFTFWPQAFLGAAFAFAVPMAFAAQTNAVPPMAWLIFFAALIWAMAYDTLYAMTDREFDIKIGVKSTAILFGRYDLLAVGILQGCMILCMGLAGYWAELGLVYYIGLLVAIVLICKQLISCQHRDPHKCYEAFLNNHWVGLAIFLGVAIDYAWPL